METPTLKPFLHDTLDEAKLSTFDFRILAHVHRRAGPNKTCFERYNRFAKRVGLHQETVSASIRRLKAAKLIAGDIVLVPMKRDHLHVPVELDDAEDLSHREFRVLFHVLRREGSKVAQESACFSSIRSIAKTTRIDHRAVPALIESLIRKGYLHRGATNGLWTKYAESRALAPKGAVKITRPLTDMEIDDLEAQGLTYDSKATYYHPAPAPLTTPKRELAKSMGQLLNSICSLFLLPARSTSELIRIAEVGHSAFRGLSDEDERCATLLYGVRCLAYTYPGLFSDALNMRDWQGAQAATARSTALDALAKYAGVRLQAKTRTDEHSTLKDKINAKYVFPGTALRHLYPNVDLLERRYAKDAEDAVLHLETPLPVTVTLRLRSDESQGLYNSLRRPDLVEGT